MTVVGQSGVRYRTIVADPPWAYPKMRGYSWREGRSSGASRDPLPYESLSADQVAALPVGDMAYADAALFLWTTQRYLWSAPGVARAWGFEPVRLLVWAKAPYGFSVTRPFGTATEFILYARRGRTTATTKVNRDWWNWPRGEHSAKPDAFLDLVEQTHPGPYAELFARRARFGWDYPIGNEALGGVAV